MHGGGLFDADMSTQIILLETLCVCVLVTKRAHRELACLCQQAAAMRMIDRQSFTCMTIDLHVTCGHRRRLRAVATGVRDRQNRI